MLGLGGGSRWHMTNQREFFPPVQMMKACGKNLKNIKDIILQLPKSTGINIHLLCNAIGSNHFATITTPKHNLSC